MPLTFDLADEAIFVLFGALLDLVTFRLEVGLKLRWFPVRVRRSNFRLPVVLYQIFEVLAICWSRVRDVVIGKPTLKLSLVPLIISCSQVY